MESVTNIQSIDQLLARIAELEAANRKLQAGRKHVGLVWKTIPEGGDAALILDRHFPLLRKDETLSCYKPATASPQEKTPHLLIEGDNLSALLALNYTHRGKIDVIYIDPPYNTGSEDFVYADRREYRATVEDRVNLAKNLSGKEIFSSARSVSKTDPFRHSKWLSFIAPRLYLAWDLLKQTGVIFISIDDNEQASLKQLCDKIFGPDAFAGMLPWRKRTAKADVPFGISQDVEYILVYAKPDYRAGRTVERQYYESEDFPDRPWRIADLTTQRTAQERPNSFFTITNPKNGNKYPASAKRTWSVTAETLPGYLARNKIVFPGDYSFIKNTRPNMRVFKDEDDAKNTASAVSTILPNDVGRSEDGGKDLYAIFGDKRFSYPKPVSLIKYLIQNFVTSKASTVLDFFAGSGTTGQAVMELNKEDGGARQAILVTHNNENGKNIASDITAMRMRRVLSGQDWADGKEHEPPPGELHYYKLSLTEDSVRTNAYRALMQAADNYAGLAALQQGAHTVIANLDACVILQDLNGDSSIVLYDASDYLLDTEEFLECLSNLRGTYNLDGNIKVYIPAEQAQIDTQLQNFTFVPYPEDYLTVFNRLVDRLMANSLLSQEQDIPEAEENDIN